MTVSVPGSSGHPVTPVTASFCWVIAKNVITLTLPPTGADAVVGQPAHVCLNRFYAGKWQ